ncbi:response regulator transcription factor [Bariatricus massiliensis]|mgnify:CR=1 FL=1|uniref:Stage 0 sporulation protein A homolog n=1 Tax=Bariatricus massiliensis TaxID=1745713 RepID=A0ABS8DES4_9FIRM|nr:response regulator transcription factor [Bariatricus massiliensis]MCB7303022.1 response regulator transcription factor [Bariatricus massiliensis]MCB7374238.1 response regulator transcription factor [Bariatricus massiliensis]MCB7386908.1 response regulator transcription factor [Bariatricus massiliensis]MCB7411070.1 response regulator transcription factor [Bariatricus massiliensis]MCQ5251896.1 response regulator transcription factor [Bariatricus massiliensis]
MNVIIIDDDCLVSGALKTILESDKDISVPAVGNDGHEAVDLYRKWLPDVLLMDIRMREMNGLTAAQTILEEFPAAKILLLTTFSDDEYIVKSLRIGAKGYLLKQDYGSIIPAIKAVHSGQTVFGGEIMAKIPGLLNKNEAFDYAAFDISEREFSIVKLVAEGLSNREIAETLYLSEGTIRNYLSTILEKLDLRDRTQLAVFYYQHC